MKRDHITSHIRVHVPLKPHKCDFCQKAFKRPQDLKKHVKTHAEDPNYNTPPEQQQRGHHGGGPGVFSGGQKHGDLQHLAVTAYGFSSDGHHMPGSAPVYQPYPNGNAANPSAYHGSANNYQANYMTTLYPVSQSTLSTEYEVRKKATFDALNEFFGDIKSRQMDPSMYHAVGQRLMNLSNLPSYSGSAEYSGGTAVATASHPSLSHYTLPMPNLRTKNDLQSIDQFLEQLQATVYEPHETANQAASAGVDRPVDHYVHAGVNSRSSHSPPRPAVAHSGHTLPPLTSTAAETTPALTPASSVMSYNSPGSVHSAAISPVSRPINPMYPTLPSTSSIADVGSAYTATSSASLTSTFDNDTRRYPTGMLQKARASSPDSLPNIDRLGVRSPSLSNVDPALFEDEPKKQYRVQSPIDPALKDGSSASADSSEDPDWIVKVRVLEAIRNMIKTRLENNDYDNDSDGDKTPKAETDHESEARSLYPVIRAIRDED